MRYHFAGHILDDVQHVLLRDGAAVPVEPQVFDLILLLARNSGRLVSRDEIVDAVWDGRIVSESAISARIAAARKAVGDDGTRQAVIRTISRRGLQMVAEVSTQDLTGTDDTGPGDVLPIRFVRLPSGHAMAYSVIGWGPPVILVDHGRTDLEAHWQLSFERARHLALARRNTLIRFDTVGSGQSDRSPDRAEIAQQAEDIGHLADALGLETFALSSNSGGCNPLLHYAAHHPDRVTRIALTGAYAEGRLVREGDTAAAGDPLRSMIAQVNTPQYGAFFDAALMVYQPEGPLEHVKAFSRMVQDAASPEFELRIRDIINAHSSMDLLDRIACPTLILHARHDAVHPLSEARKLAAGIARAQLVILESANHIPWPENPAYETYISTLSDFLSE